MSEQQPGVISTEPHDKAVIAIVTCKTLDAVSAGRLEADVSAAAMQSQNRVVVLDMSKVEFAPSVALGALLRTAQDLKFFGRRLIVVGLNRQVRGTLAVTRIDKVLEIRDSQAVALAMIAKTA